MSTGAAPPETLDDDPPVRLIMVPIARVEVPPGTRVASALDRLRRLATDHLLIRRDGRTRALTELELLRHLENGGSRPARMADPAWDVARPVATVGPEMRRSRAAELLLSEDPPVLVVTIAGTPCGVLDARTVLRSVSRDR